MAQIAAGRHQIRLGALEPTRDFNFVADTVGAFLSVAEAEDKVVAQTFNAGSGREISIGDLVHTAARAMGAGVDVVPERERLRRRPARSCAWWPTGRASRPPPAGPRPTHVEQGLAVTASWFCDPVNLARYRVDSYVV